MSHPLTRFNTSVYFSTRVDFTFLKCFLIARNIEMSAKCLVLSIYVLSQTCICI